MVSHNLDMVAMDNKDKDNFRTKDNMEVNKVDMEVIILLILKNE